MVKIFLTSLFVLGLFCGCATHPPDVKPSAISKLNYTIEPAVFDNKPALKITLSFITESDRQILALPERWAGQKDYFKDIRELKTLTPGTSLEDTKTPFLKTILAPKNTSISISYILTAVQSAEFNGHRALITPDYFHVIGHNLWPYPAIPQEQPVNILINWNGFPKNYSFANSFGALRTEQNFSASINQLREAIYVGGDFRILEERVHDNPVFIAIRGKWLFKDRDFSKHLKKIIEGQRQFWNDDNFPYFLITLIPNGKACCISGGSGLTQSFITYMAADKKIDPDLSSLYSHELFHTWNGEKIRVASPESRHYWFSEGLTSYYTRIMNLRNGLITLQDYVDNYNDAIYKYYFSKFKNVPNSRVEKDFFDGSGLDKIPYYRGDFLAHRWNMRIKKETGASIDQPMRDVFTLAQSKGTKVSNDTWKSIMTPYLDITEDLSRFIDAGETIVPDSEALGPCVQQKVMEVGWFEYSFDRNKTYDSNIITGLITDSPGYKAGLRDGQQLLDRTIIYPPFAESSFKIKDKNGVRWIKFFPVGTDKRTIPFYFLDKEKFAKDPKACLAWFN